MLVWLAAALVVTTAVLGVVLVADTARNLTAPWNLSPDMYSVNAFREATDIFRSANEGILRVAWLVIPSLLASAGMLLAFAYGRAALARRELSVAAASSDR